ncbi:cupin domain-containing protein (plasmid) [Rhizobium sp. CC1099]|uniref:cupin domain-containing protein n=1 Tax=Rhizobium sp. CC1099 TaxID=3039160 RepID=UPI0024B1C65C|nr:cupin domain-containing protein [Rhizobium sp. CC1099]WFU91393.1 cupin domain-containing protein [Rhizobium sp. CC1099]
MATASSPFISEDSFEANFLPVTLVVGCLGASPTKKADAAGGPGVRRVLLSDGFDQNCLSDARFVYCSSGHVLISSEDHQENIVAHPGDLVALRYNAVATILNLDDLVAELIVADTTSDPISVSMLARGEYRLGNRLSLSRRTCAAQSAVSWDSTVRSSVFEGTVFIPPQAQTTIAILSKRQVHGSVVEYQLNPTVCELGYVVSGRGRITLADRNGQVDTFEARRGDVYCMPAGSSCCTETLGDGELSMLAIFERADEATGTWRSISLDLSVSIVSLELDARPERHVAQTNLSPKARRSIKIASNWPSMGGNSLPRTA